MITRLCYAIIMLLLLTSPLAAQDDTATPFPVLDEAAIFADGVTVIERLPVLNFDNEARELYYFNPITNEWEIYPYPDEVQHDLMYSRFVNGQYFVTDWYSDDFRSSQEHWLFRVGEGFSPAEPKCGLERITYENYGYWVVEQLPDEQYRLCNTATGENTPPLNIANFTYPDYSCYEIRDWEGQRSNTSPNEEWIIFANCINDWEIYAYHLPTNQVNYLGSFTLTYEDLLIRYWHSDTEVAILASELSMTNSAYRTYYFMDVSQPNNIIDIGHDGYDEAINSYIDERVDSAEGSYRNFVRIFNPETLSFETLMNYECGSARTDCLGGSVAVSQDFRYVAIAEHALYETHPGLLIYDTVQDNVVYQDTNLDVSEIVWTSNNELLFQVGLQGGDYRRLDVNPLSQQEPAAITITNRLPLALSPSRRFGLHQVDNEWLVYDFETDESYPVFSPDTYPDCSRSVFWNGNELDVYMCSGFYYRWRVRVDAMDEDNS